MKKPLDNNPSYCCSHIFSVLPMIDKWLLLMETSNFLKFQTNSTVF